MRNDDYSCALYPCYATTTCESNIRLDFVINLIRKLVGYRGKLNRKTKKKQD